MSKQEPRWLPTDEEIQDAYAKAETHKFMSGSKGVAKFTAKKIAERGDNEALFLQIDNNLCALLNSLRAAENKRRVNDTLTRFRKYIKNWRGLLKEIAES